MTKRPPLAPADPPKWEELPVTAGSLNSERLPRALAPRKFMIRQDSLAEMFNDAGKRLGAVDVPNARENKHARPWARLFQNEPAYLYAEILSFRADDAGFSFSEALEYDPTDALRQTRALSDQLTNWRRRIQHDNPRTFSKQLNQMDKDQGLFGLLDRMYGKRPAELVQTAKEHRTVLAAMKSGGPLAEARALRERLRAIHTLLRNAVMSLQSSAQTAFDARISSGKIDPGLGLLLAELRTAGHVNAVFNDLPERHTTLYYQDIIGQKPAVASPEMVLLDLGRVPRAGFLPQGTTLEARLPDGTVQNFETDAGVPVSPAEVSDIKILSYGMDDNISYNRALGGITSLRAATVTPQSASTSKTLFGAGVETPPDFGLDICTPMLSLAEGTRRIEVSLHMNRNSNLPTSSRGLSQDEINARDKKRKKAANPDTPPKLRSDVNVDPNYRDPEVRLALAADPTLISTFYDKKPEDAIEDLTREVTEFADVNNIEPSVALIYDLLLKKVKKAGQIRLLLGRMVALSLIEQHPFPKDEKWTEVFEKVQEFRADLIGVEPEEDQKDEDAEEVAPEHKHDTMIFAAFSKRPDGKINYELRDVFQSLLGDAFSLTVTTDEGPRRPDIMQIMPVQEKRAMGGITLSFRYDDDAPALTGPNHAPRLSLRYATDARLCPLSFFEAYGIETISIRTQVTGLRKLTAFSDDGPVSTGQTFQPFGPRPSEGATFQVGCAEMARKPVTSVGIALEWSGMPNPAGGFKTHYASYGRGIDIPDPELTVDYLSGDGWKTVSRAPEPLFQSQGSTSDLSSRWEYSGTITGFSVPATGAVTTKEYQSRQTIRAGMVRLRLNGTAGGFLADRYPVALVEAMRPRLIKLGERKIPPAPFVPEVSNFTLSYTAEGIIELNAPETARTGEEVYQSGPFGKVCVFPKHRLKQVQLFPKRLGYGQVCFQLTGPNKTGATALTINLAAFAHLRRIPSPNPLVWMYLSAHGWQKLPETAISSDTTDGLMRSGIVVLDLPEDATQHSSEMPDGGAWVAAVATEPNIEIFPRLAQAKVNGVWARRTDDSWKKPDDARVWAFTPARAGLTTVNEIPTPGDSRPPEMRPTYVARVGERLRHRRRGVTPWDMERLVLEHFPDVWMAKCLPHLSQESPNPDPGRVTLVVVRKALTDSTLTRPEPALFDVSTLQRIATWLSDFISPQVKLDVVNPTFDRLQVRAKLQISANRENGAMTQILRRDLARYLSVWTAQPAMRRFGWSLNVQMLRAHMEALDHVEKVTDFSVLHMSGNDNHRYQLLDTAQGKRDPRGSYGPVLRPRFPWSLPLSTPEHVLTILRNLNDEHPTAAGIGSLPLGEMLIVGQRTIP